jgi:hypothetical protein
MKHLTSFITSAGKVPFEAGGNRWLMRQPLPDEAADGDSAYRIAYNRVMKDKRLKDLAQGDKLEIEREARIRATAAEAIYMLPLLLETPTGEPAFDVADEASLSAFEQLEPEVIIELTRIYFEVIKLAISEAKKKSTADSSSESGSARVAANGRSPAGRGTRPGPRS